MQLTSPTEPMTQQAKLGRVRFLAVASKVRSPLAPDLPLISDTLPGFHNDGWFGLLAPAGSPPAQIQKVGDALRKVMAEPEMRERFVQLYMDPTFLDAQQFAVAVDDAVDFWRTVITELGIQPS